MERITELEQCHAETTEVLKQSHAVTLAAHQMIERLQGQSPVAWVAGDEEIRDFHNGREVYVMRDCDDSELEYFPLYATPPIASVFVPDGLIVAVNHLLNVDGTRGCYSAVECHNAREKVERLLAAAPGA